MFRIVGCSGTTYYKIAHFCKVGGEFSQENLAFMGILVGYMQPNMIGEPGDPDFFWCRRFLRWFF